MTLPTDYVDAATPTGALTELPATTARGLNAITAQINTNTTAIAGKAEAVDINVEDYGAVGDGATDDTAAINAAIAAAFATSSGSSNGGATVVFPPGIYNVTGPIHVRPALTATGTAQAGAASTITLAAGASAVNLEHTWVFITLTGGTGSGQTRLISSYDGSTKVATVSAAWTTTPDNTSQYSIQYWAGNVRTVNLRGASPLSTKIRAAAGFADPSPDGRTCVLRCEGTSNERYGGVVDMAIDGNSIAEVGLYVGPGVVERSFTRILVQGATETAMLVDAAQNCWVSSVHLTGGTECLRVVNGAAGWHFDRVELGTASTTAMVLDVDATLRGHNWNVNIDEPFANLWTKCIFEQGSSNALVPMRINAGKQNQFHGCVFSTTYTSGTAAAACVVVGDGTGTYEVYNNHFSDSTFYRNNDPSAQDLLVVSANTSNTVLSHCLWGGGHASAHAAVRASGTVLFLAPTFLNTLAEIVDTGSGNIQMLTGPRISGPTTARPTFSATSADGVRPPWYNTTTGKWEAYNGTDWEDLYVLPTAGVPVSDLAATGTPDSTTFLRGDGAWAGGAGGGIGNVVEDLTPQLGGNLDLNGFTVGAATAADLTKLNGVTATAVELNHVDGVTSAVQTQLDGKQASHATLTALSTDVASARTALGVGTGDSPLFATVNLGAGSDTTLSRLSAGRAAVEGVELATVRANVNTQTGTSYTLALTDERNLIECNNASPFTLTVPPNSSVALPVDSVIPVDQIGAGQVTVAAGAGVTIQSKGGALKLTGQYSSACLRKRATDTWILTGDLTT